jgi:hypothetical protein
MTTEAKPAANRELDAKVASRLLGWTDVKFQGIANVYGQQVLEDFAGLPPGGNGMPVIVPRYSTHVQAAWELLERLRKDCAFAALISGRNPAGGVQPWICKVNKDGGFIEERADSPAAAICQAALKAAGP